MHFDEVDKFFIQQPIMNGMFQLMNASMILDNLNALKSAHFILIRSPDPSALLLLLLFQLGKGNQPSTSKNGLSSKRPAKVVRISCKIAKPT